MRVTSGRVIVTVRFSFSPATCRLATVGKVISAVSVLLWFTIKNEKFDCGRINGICGVKYS